MLAVVEPSVGTQRAQERLLERIVGAIDAEPSTEQPKNLGPMLLVEALERGDRHGLHHPRQTLVAVDL
jgi:hypothetical protein